MTKREAALRLAISCIANSRSYQHGAVFSMRNPETEKWEIVISYQEALRVIMDMADEEGVRNNEM